MERFVDEIVIIIRSGTGGDGCVSFRREKYVPRGGPDGGDGGRGGDVVFKVNPRMRTLGHLIRNRIYAAQDGDMGRSQKRHGKAGETLEIEVPAGTLIRDGMNRTILHDFSREKRPDHILLARGGKGGIGNHFFRSSRNRAPRRATPGAEGEQQQIQLELNTIADIGFVGAPNAGKSSLLRAITGARPRVGSYAFTTTRPYVGVIQLFDREILCADIPGILKDASKGVGLGIKFLRHIDRAKLLAIIISLEKDNWIDEIEMILHELYTYNPELLTRPRIILASKIDLPDAEARLEQMRAEIVAKYGNDPIGYSAITKVGLEQVKQACITLFDSVTEEPA